MGNFNAKIGRRKPSAMPSAIGLYGLEEANEAGDQLETSAATWVGSGQYVQTASKA